MDEKPSPRGNDTLELPISTLCDEDQRREQPSSLVMGPIQVRGCGVRLAFRVTHMILMFLISQNL